jgi:hypothetical protein
MHGGGSACRRRVACVSGEVTMMLWQRMMAVTMLLGALAALDSCLDDSAARDASLIQRKVAEVEEQNADQAGRRIAARPDEPDPCEGVSEADIARVEKRMQRLDRELVTLGPEEMQALVCSRSRDGH